MDDDPAAHGLEPALELSSYVAAVKRGAAGRERRLRPPVRRRPRHLDRHCCRSATPTACGAALTNNCDVLIGGRALSAGRHRQHGQRHGRPRPEPARGRSATTAMLIGRDGAERQTAEDLARRLETINYEILCGISRRVPRDLPPRRAPGVSRRPRSKRWRRSPAAAGSSAAPSATACSSAAHRRLRRRRSTGPAEPAARALAAHAGALAFELSEGFGAWRVIARDRSWQVDLLPLGGDTIEADLARRDLTINAIAEPLGGGGYVDPFGGRRGSAGAAAADGLAPTAFATIRCARCGWLGWPASSSFEVEPAPPSAPAASAPRAGRRRRRAGVRRAQADRDR